MTKGHHSFEEKIAESFHMILPCLCDCSTDNNSVFFFQIHSLLGLAVQLGEATAIAYIVSEAHTHIDCDI